MASDASTALMYFYVNLQRIKNALCLYANYLSKSIV